MQHDSSDSPKFPLGESHRRHLSVSIRHVVELLDDADRILSASRVESPFQKYSSDLAPWQAGPITDQIAAIRQKLARAGRELGLDVAGHPIDARHALRVQATFADITVEEMHARYLRGYGSIDEETARQLDALVDELSIAIGELTRAIAVRPGESVEARIARLARTPVSPDILSLLDALITKYHLSELRRPMTTLVDRIEQHTFDIAVFGRVSSGKSSLLNALVGSSILPVGVTPITAVPTRIRFGSSANVLVVFGDGHEETLDVASLADLASEGSNPGNRRRVARLEVKFPSPLLREGVELVDTPGIGSLATHGAEETIAYLPRADLAILLVDVGAAIGDDEISILRLLASAAIPCQIVISKADLADTDSLERMTRYLGDVVKAETGGSLRIDAVSAMPSHVGLLRTWIDEVIHPLVDARDTMLDASIRRTTGALRDAITARLEAIANRGPTVETTGAEARMRQVVFDLRHAIDNVPPAVEGAVAELVRKAATEALSKADEPWDPRATLVSLAERYLDEIRKEILERRQTTIDRLGGIAREMRIPLDLVQVPDHAEELDRLPLLDVGAALPAIRIAKPWFAPGFARPVLERSIEHRLGPALRRALSSYGHQLRDWAIRSVDRIQASFATVFDSTRTDEANDVVDPNVIEEDLRGLAALMDQSDQPATKEIGA